MTAEFLRLCSDIDVSSVAKYGGRLPRLQLQFEIILSLYANNLGYLQDFFSNFITRCHEMIFKLIVKAGKFTRLSTTTRASLYDYLLDSGYPPAQQELAQLLGEKLTSKRVVEGGDIFKNVMHNRIDGVED